MTTQTFRQRKGIAAYRSVQRMAPQIVERRRNPSFDVAQAVEPSWLVLIGGAVAVIVAWFVFGWFVVRMIELFGRMA